MNLSFRLIFREVLYQIEQCEMENYEVDPIQLAKVFIDKVSLFFDGVNLAIQR